MYNTTPDKRRKIIVAPNSFKGSLSGIEAAECIAKGIKRSGIAADVILYPVADGGSDTMLLLTTLRQAKIVSVKTRGPYGNPVSGNYGWLSDEKLAIIGFSEASGLQYKTSGSDIMLANSYGTGEQISDAIKRGAEKVVIGVGGSATSDGGAGLLMALGLRLLSHDGVEISQIPEALPKVAHVDASLLKKKMGNCRIVVLCDVENKLLGKEGAARVFAPQKGASAVQVEEIEKCMEAWNEITKRFSGIDMSAVRYGGAAGGSAAGLFAWAGARLVSGINYFLDEFGFDKQVADADYVLTGEGKIDSQTLKGKAPYGVAKRAASFGIPVIAFAGQAEILNQHLFSEIILINQSTDIEKEIKNTPANLENAACNWMKRIGNE